MRCVHCHLEKNLFVLLGVKLRLLIADASILPSILASEKIHDFSVMQHNFVFVDEHLEFGFVKESVSREDVVRA